MPETRKVVAKATVELTVEVVHDGSVGEFSIERLLDDPERRAVYGLESRTQVVEHWAYNAAANGVEDVRCLDGWADVPQGTCMLYATDVETEVINNGVING